MFKHPSLFTILLAAMLAVAAPLPAQQRSAVSRAELDGAVARRPVGSRPTTNGVRAVGTPSRSQAAAQKSVAESKDQALAGGDETFVISSTVVIIALLVIIIILVA